MSRKANVFTDILTDFQQRMVRLVSYQGFVEWQLDRAKSSVIKDFAQFEKNGWEKHSYFSGHSLSIVNVFHDGEWITRAAGGGTVTRGDDILLMSEEMARKFNAFMLVYVFEAIEQYVISLYAELLYQLRGEISLKYKAHFHRNNDKAKRHEGTPAYYRKYSKWVCRKNCDIALVEFAKQLQFERILVQMAGLSSPLM